jgi:hypothetical protein
MLRHFDFARLLGIRSEDDLWTSASNLLHATSVVPHAAFKERKMFAGSFDEILASSILSRCFEESFVTSLSMLPRDALFIALGKTPLDALYYCAQRNVIREDQVLGALAHPSRSAGTQVAIYLGERSIDDLHPKDPVRGRVTWLRQAYAQMSRATSLLRTPARTEPSSSSTQRAHTSGHGSAAETTCSVLSDKPTARAADEQKIESGLHYVVKRGKAAGTVLRPHVQNGHYIVSPTRFEMDYVFVPINESLEPYLSRGLSLRMSAPGVAPSLISPASIRGRDRRKP